MTKLLDSFMEHRPVSPVGTTIKPDQLKAVQEEIKTLRTQLAKATNEAGQHKITAEYSSRHLSQCEAALSSEQDKREEVEQRLAKANERVKELEQNQLPVENGKNRYGLDVSYFRNAINRELNRELVNHKPDELARVLARLSRTADESVMFEPEFSNKFAIEKKIEAFEKYASMCEAFRTVPSIEGLRHHAEQLRKGQE